MSTQRQKSNRPGRSRFADDHPTGDVDAVLLFERVVEEEHTLAFDGDDGCLPAEVGSIYIEDPHDITS